MGVMKKLKNGCSRPVCVGKPMKPCPVYGIRCQRGQRKVMKKLRNGCSRPVCVGKPIIKPPVRCPKYRLRPCKGGSVRSWIKLKNGCKKPICKPIIIPVKKCCRKIGRRKICSPRYCKKRCPKYRLGPCKFGRRKICSSRYCKTKCPVYRPAPCKGGQKMVTITLNNGCKRPICKTIKKKCCRKFGRRKICSTRYCKKRCPKYRLRPCKYGSVRSWITLKNGCKRPVCVNKPTPVRCCRKLGSTVKCGIKFCRSTPVTPSPVTPEPSQPVTPAPTKPDEPSKPVTPAPSPVTQAPEQPVTQAPTKPDEPSKPVTQAPTKPDEPSKPVPQAPTKPDEPSKPVPQAPTK